MVLDRFGLVAILPEFKGSTKKIITLRKTKIDNFLSWTRKVLHAVNIIQFYKSGDRVNFYLKKFYQRIRTMHINLD